MTCWIIKRYASDGGVIYWCGGLSSMWSIDPYRAVRLAREADAKQLIDRYGIPALPCEYTFND